MPEQKRTGRNTGALGNLYDDYPIGTVNPGEVSLGGQLVQKQDQRRTRLKTYS